MQQRTHYERELGRYKTPNTILAVGELPRGPLGEIQRLNRAELARSA